MKRRWLLLFLAFVLVCGVSSIDKNQWPSAVTEGIEVNETTFPGISRWIKTQVDPNCDGFLTTAEIEKITEIDMWNYRYEDLPGLAPLTSLKRIKTSASLKGELAVFPDWVEEIEYRGTDFAEVKHYPANLRSLRLLSDEIEDISGLPEGLEELICSSSALKKISELPEGLEIITIYGTCLKELPQLPESIEKINVKDNWMRGSLDFRNLPNLRSLNIFDNQVEEVLLHPECPLTYLNVSRNWLKGQDSVKGKTVDWNGKNFIFGKQDPVAAHVTEETFPDENFRNYILQEILGGYGSVLKQSTVDTYKSLDLSGQGIQSLEGIQYFTALRTLICKNNELEQLPALPDSLWELYCDGNKLTSLPALPAGLQELSVNKNKLTELGKLPAKLSYLGVSSNQLTSLPTLPANLGELVCNYNQLTSLPKLPSGLYSLACIGNQLTKLPALPKKLESLNCGSNQLKRLPTLPANISTLKCSNNQIEGVLGLRNLKKLQYIYCNGNRITAVLLRGELGTDPYTYTAIDVSNNYIADKSYVYGNKTFKWNGKKFIFGKQKGADCTYKNGTVTKPATFSLFGERKATCSHCGETIYKPIPQIVKVKLSFTTTPYTGSKKAGPKVTLTDAMGKTISKSNYSVTYGTGRKAIGKYKVIIKGKNLYSGSSTKYFKIVPKGTKLTSASAKQTTITVKWTKKTSQITGYQISYGTSTSPDKGKKILITKKSTNSRTITKLKKGQKYHVWVRTYKLVNGTKYYSAWSARKTVKTLK